MREVWIAIAGARERGYQGNRPGLRGGRDLPERAVGVITFLAPALLTALVVTSTFSEARTLALDARATGVCVAALALALRAPMLVVVLLAAVSTSLVRALS